MFCLRTPSTDQIRQFISSQQESAFSYPEVGASAGEIPSSYIVDGNRILLGQGEATWHRAVRAIREWQMFDIPWIRLYWPSAPIEVGINVAILVRHLGFCSLNASRIVYLVDEDRDIERYGFAYGTLLEHAETGEERFTVEWNRLDDQVWYDILAFSRPNKLLAKLGFPFSRALQKKFAEASKAAMFNAVHGTK